jgi:hypothetical protein
LKIPFTKKAGGVAQSEGPEFKPQYRKKNVRKGGGDQRETIITLVFQPFIA